LFLFLFVFFFPIAKQNLAFFTLIHFTFLTIYPYFLPLVFICPKASLYLKVVVYFLAYFDLVWVLPAFWKPVKNSASHPENFAGLGLDSHICCVVALAR